MYAEERQQQIVGRARAEGRIDVAQAAEEFSVTPETIRRDLRVLERHGLVRRVHGGAFATERAGSEMSLSTRSTRMVAEKQRIGKAAAALLGDAESVFVDEGMTPRFVAEALPTDAPLTVITAALPTALALADNPAITIIQLGGRIRGRTLATVDYWTSRMLDDLAIDLAILSANGVSRQHGMTTPDPAVAEVKHRAARSARRRVFVADHTKFGVDSFCRFADVRDFAVIVTDSGLSAAEAHRYEMLGPQVVRA
jgi:DeoR family transcriptional regulator, fructose operon transcriptional repressor